MHKQTSKKIKSLKTVIVCNCINLQKSPVLRKCIQDGFVHCFEFIEAMLVNRSNNLQVYHIAELNLSPMPCPKGEVVICTFLTPDGLGAHALLPFPEDNEFLY